MSLLGLGRSAIAALGRGLAKSLGFKLFKGESSTSLGELIARSVPDIVEGDKLKIQQHVFDSLSAGSVMSDIGGDKLVPLQSIPVNPFLFASDPQGDRLSFVAEIVFTDDSNNILKEMAFQFTSPFNMSRDEVERAIRDQADEWIDQSGEEILGTGESPGIAIGIRPVLIEREY